MDADIKFGDDYAINKLLRAKNRFGRNARSPAALRFGRARGLGLRASLQLVCVSQLE